MILFSFGAALAVSDVISAERREGTLGVLFLTSLRSWELLVGLALAAGARFLLCLVAIVPVLMLPILSGGVAWAEVLRQCLNVLVVVWLGIAVGIFWSVLCREAKTSALSSVVTLFLVSILPLSVALFLASGIGRGPSFLEIFIAGPAFMVPLSLTEILKQESVWAYVVSVLGVTVFGVVFFLLARSCFEVLWRREARGRSASREVRKSENRFLRMIQKDWIVPTFERRHALRFPDGVSPYEVLAGSYSRDLPFLRIVIPVLALIYFLVSVAAIQVGSSLMRSEFYWLSISSLVLLDFMVRLNVCIEAPRQITTDRKSGMLELILTTPLPNRQIVLSLLTGMAKTQQGKGFLLAAAHLFQAMLLAANGMSLGANGMSYETPKMIALHLGLGILSAVDVQTIQRLGVWYGLHGLSVQRSWLQLAFFAYLLPLFVLLFILGGVGRGQWVVGVVLIVLWHWARWRVLEYLLDRVGADPARVRHVVGRSGTV